MPTLTFKTEEEKNAALDAIPDDAPNGVDVTAWKNEQEAKIDDIMAAQVDPEGGEPKNTDLDPDKLEIEKPNEDIKPDENANLSLEKENPPAKNDFAEELERNNSHLRNQRDETLDDNTRLESEILELRRKNEELTKNKDKPPAEKNLVDEEIVAVQNEIDNLEKEMNKQESDDVYDESHIKNLKKQGQLSLKLNSLNHKRSQDLINLQKTEIETLKNDQVLRKKRQDEDSERVVTNRNIEEFRTGNKELQTGQTYLEMDKKYYGFAMEVASQWYDKASNKITAAETEVAMAKYVSATPELIERLRNKGIKEPANLKEYLTISEVNALSKGYVMDKQTGKWKRLKDGLGNPVNFPNMDAAYSYYKTQNGTYQEEILNKQNDSVKSYNQATNQRTNPSDIEQEHRNASIDSMTKERAERIMADYSERDITLRARENFKDPLVQEYNKAMKALGYPEMTEDDFS